MLLSAEWLETDGLGGFASGTVGSIRTRRYHSLLTAATENPSVRVTLVKGFEVWLVCEGSEDRIFLSSQRYHPGIVFPNGITRLQSFEINPWPTWRFKIQAAATIEHQLFMLRGAPVVVCSWTLRNADKNYSFFVRPLLSATNLHDLQRYNKNIDQRCSTRKDGVIIRPFRATPDILMISNGTFIPDADWYMNFLYEEELSRGYDHTEDLASPGVFNFNLKDGEEAQLILSSEELVSSRGLNLALPAARLVTKFREVELAWRKPLSNLERAGRSFIVKRGSSSSIIAGYPWFGEWARDTFISMRGLTISNGELQLAKEIFCSWLNLLSEGMFPNKLPERPEESKIELEYNSVDAPLWFIVSAYEFIKAAQVRTFPLDRLFEKQLLGAIDQIMTKYINGTRFGIHADTDGLITYGQEGLALTWMDARINNSPVTARNGKAVEIQALWINSLHIATELGLNFKNELNRAQSSFEERFWNKELGCLYDLVDGDGITGTADATLRPNQIFAVGGLPFQLIHGERALRLINILERDLLTTCGLRTLNISSPSYRGSYQGSQPERDASYHQGTVWPWLIGPFIEGWLRVHTNLKDGRKRAQKKFIQPLQKKMEGYAAGGFVTELADGNSPFHPRGAPFQAWSLAELLRVGNV